MDCPTCGKTQGWCPHTAIRREGEPAQPSAETTEREDAFVAWLEKLAEVKLIHEGKGR